MVFMVIYNVLGGAHTNLSSENGINPKNRELSVKKLESEEMKK